MIIICLCFLYLSVVNSALAPNVKWQEYPFVVILTSLHSNSTVNDFCTGSVISKATNSYILTSASCSQDKTHILVPSPKGAMKINNHTFNLYEISFSIQHPNVSKTDVFTIMNTSFVLPTTDLAIVGVTGLTKETSLQVVRLTSLVPQPLHSALILGFGGKEFGSLTMTDATAVMGYFRNREDVVFIVDVRKNVTMGNAQYVMRGDRGSPILDGDGEQFAVSGNMLKSNFVSYATQLGPNMEWIAPYRSSAGEKTQVCFGLGLLLFMIFKLF